MKEKSKDTQACPEGIHLISKIIGMFQDIASKNGGKCTVLHGRTAWVSEVGNDAGGTVARITLTRRGALSIFGSLFALDRARASLAVL